MATIIVVDDLAANREVLTTLLRYQGHRLLEAANGRDALALAQAERPDLVITDVLMPVMDGYELVKQLRADPTISHTPVLFYTAHYGESEARALALSSGVASVLIKPIDPQDVLTVVGQVLARGPGAGPLAGVGPLSPEFDHAHLRLLTDKLSRTDEGLRMANARLRALINIGLELASEGDAERLLNKVCAAARDLFNASYATVGILARHDRTVQQVVTSGVDAASGVPIGGAAPGVLGTVTIDRQPLRGQNAGGDPTRLGLPPSHPPVHSLLIAPIASPAHVYGWICLVGNEGEGFSDDDEQLVMALSGQVGRIYENGYFYSVARQERDRAQRYLDTAEVILLALDLDGRVTLVNRKGATLLEWSESELIGRDWIATCVPARLHGRLRATFDALVAGDLSIVETPVVSKSGRERLIEWRNTLLRDDAGQVVGTFSSGTDITEQHEAVEALRTAEERMRFALQSADVGIWDMDYRTGTLRCSETLEAHYGVPPGTFGGTFDDFIGCVHPDDRASMVDTITRATKSGSDFLIENRAIWPDGTVRWLTGVGRILLGEHGQPVRGVGISLDSTERRTLEQQYHQSQKMEAVGRLAGGVAHDFNNLLTAILGYCELLLADRPTDGSDYQDITEIQKAGIRAAGLTRQLLAFSRKQIIEPSVLDMNGIVADMQPMLERLIGEDVKVVLGLRPDVSPVLADRGQIEQIVMNLAVNARDAMPGGGVLTIDTVNVELDEHYAQTHFGVKPGAYVALAVTDTGTGMAPDVMARLFEPFFTTKEPGRGTGLGLATVHGIVMRSGGSVGVYSELGKGTSFKVYLPQARPGDAVETPRAAPRQVGGAETILVVEDAEGLRHLAKRLLEKQGYRVLLAADADEAVGQFERHADIDVLLTDVVMPGASGPELTERLRRQRPSLKVIYMSGYTEDAITHHGVLVSGVAFVNKPFTADTLGQKIREVLDR
jgi:two-component system, cell cycle sensor histidine kinase and response regulator CckA